MHGRSRMVDIAAIEEAVGPLCSPFLQRERERGTRVIGFFCSYVPEEVLNMTGWASYRMRATVSTGTEAADSYMGCFNCGYTRHCFELGLKEEYRFIDGFVFASGCDHLRRLYDNWSFYLDPGFVHILDVPHLREDISLEWYADQIRNLHTTLARRLGVPADAESLWEAIKKTNRTRALLRSIDELRRTGQPRLTGREMLAISLFASSTPKHIVNPILEELLGTLASSERTLPRSYRAAVLLVGSNLDDPELVDLIEETGALVVADSFCCGLRDLADPVAEDPDQDPYAALAARYLDRLSCPRMYADFPRRLGKLLEMARTTGVDGVIVEHLAFCETWGVDSNMLVRSFRANGIPALKLERDYRLSSIGQIRTRVQAFIESMGK